MASNAKLDLNCDLGESFGRYQLGEDAAMMPWITSVNVACGFHAGDPQVMARTVALAARHGVAVGAHPGYPDLQGFGRRAMGMTPEEIEVIVLYQLGALSAFTRANKISLVHVKPHGALYNLAAQDRPAAEAVASAVRSFNRELVLVGLAGSALVAAGEDAGLSVASEGFPDRAYLPDGQLTPRRMAGAVITEPGAVADNALRMAQEGINIDGRSVPVDTLCLHGDNPAAVRNAQAVREALEKAGIELGPLNG
ncbi:LamB/YcsF family protein [bacterium]|nr:LamB/YcsF family protein [bacterium]